MTDATQSQSGDRRVGGRPRRVTMSDVARKAGVSSAAVSYALSGAPGVSEERRQRILVIAEEMGFRPNRIARELRAGTTKAIGLLLADIANPFYTEVAGGVVAAAAEEGYEVFVSHVGVDGSRQADVALAQVDRNCSGLIFTSLVADDKPLLDKLRHENIPIVQLYRKIDSEPSDWVGIDDYSASFEMASHVVATGRRNVAILGGPGTSSVSANRMSGYRDALAKAGVQAINEPELWGDLTRASGAQRARALFAEHLETDAIVCGNDLIALGVLDVCREIGKRVPEDVALTGFDDMSFSSAGPLQLSTVTVPRDLMGQRAARMILQRIAGDESPPRNELLPYSIQVRDTTARRG
ncbi:LacI family DNA-binding transcriptional regulator [Rhodococcus oxybenzonivorans]|uniref:LacI family DNA-binding transcriptional regulator n=1 Tax=Rhodococcus oxybenzonivorans TaxID=1990687 RepID=UPI002953A28E|nr:LacI family DNA-binding transcriptional regulator [Rhodococcus oxybenzonivorans]MDV7354577.1 LacI family DNA-binding transcriptional regulator [Rhodococcus oxybenzonivorans]